MFTKISNIFQNTFNFILFAILGIFVQLIVILILFLLLPFVIYRKIIFNLAPILRPDLGKILSLTSLVFAHSNKNPLCGSIVGEIHFNGVVDFEKFKNDFWSKILELKKKNGQLVYPELKQIFTPWMGHLFWKNALNFDIEDHFALWTKSTFNQSQDLKLIRKEILIESYPQGKPLWIIYCVPNPMENSTVIFIKHHHSYFDGFSLLKMMTKIFKIQDKLPQKKSRGERLKISSIFKQLIKFANTPILFTQNLFNLFTRSTDWQRMAKVPNSEFFTPEIIPLGLTNLMPFKKLKEIASVHNVNVSSVILASIAGGIRRFMFKNGYKIPDDIILGTSAARPGHPNDKLRNYVYSVFISLPIGEFDPLKRLNIIYKRKKSIQNSYFVEFFHFFLMTISNLPNCLFKSIVEIKEKNKFPFPVFYGGTPGPRGPPISWRDINADIKGFFGGGAIFGLPLGLTSMNNHEGIQFYMGGSQAIFQNDEGIQELASFIEKELDVLLEFKPPTGKNIEISCV